jgi:hypothetical protein
MSKGEELVEAWLTARGYPYVAQWRFHPIRRWRFDFALGYEPLHPRMGVSKTLERLKLAIEVEGGQFTGGHKRGKAADSDTEKFNEATLRGWRVLRFTTGQVERGEAWPVIERAWHQR